MDEGNEGRRIAELRPRIDGFTGEKQKIFLKTLRRTGCVRDAARKAGISTTSIDRARRQFADFDAKCRPALALATPKLEAIAFQRATVGARAKVIRKGVVVEVRQKPSDAMLRLLLQGANPLRYGRMAGIAEIEKGRRKAKSGPARGRPRPLEEVHASILAKIEAIRRHRIQTGAMTEGPEGVLVPAGWRMVREEELLRLGWTPPEEGAG